LNMADEKRDIAAPCGLYCGACTIYLAGKRGDRQLLGQIAQSLSQQMEQELKVEDLACDGCLSTETVAAVCRFCDIRDCALGKGLTNCSMCREVPCKRISDFNSDQYAHHHEVLENIRHQQDSGIDTWLSEQETKWQCSECSHDIDWYAVECPGCGAMVTSPFRT